MTGCLAFLMLTVLTLILLVLSPLLGIAWILILGVILILWVVGLVIYLIARAGVEVGMEVGREMKEKLSKEIIKSRRPPNKWIRPIQRKIIKFQWNLDSESEDLMKDKGKALCIKRINQLITFF